MMTGLYDVMEGLVERLIDNNADFGLKAPVVFDSLFPGVSGV
ncbi:MAG: hypothetical protein NTX06_07725 [Proteobacteria bacterium]|nr:hypothetical protein [Pseudomonadota bacterium]